MTDKFWYILGKLLDFLLRRDDKYYLEMVRRGQVAKGRDLKKLVEKSKIKGFVKEITLVGFIEDSEEEFEKQKRLIEQGRFKPYFPKLNSSLKNNFIEFFQIETENGDYYILAFYDKYDFEYSDECLWLYKLIDKVDTSLLSIKDYVFYSSQLSGE